MLLSKAEFGILTDDYLERKHSAFYSSLKICFLLEISTQASFKNWTLSEWIPRQETYPVHRSAERPGEPGAHWTFTTLFSPFCTSPFFWPFLQAFLTSSYLNLTFTLSSSYSFMSSLSSILLLYISLLRTQKWK